MNMTSLEKTHPMFSFINDRAFNEARKTLATATRIDAVHCLTAVRRLVADMLASLCVDPIVVRLVLSDIAETLLAREALRIADLEAYQSVNKIADRENLMEIALTGYLFDWALSRVDDASQRQLILQGAQNFASHLTGARPS
jgi:hypothetical protein